MTRMTSGMKVVSLLFLSIGIFARADAVECKGTVAENAELDVDWDGGKLECKDLTSIGSGVMFQAATPGSEKCVALDITGTNTVASLADFTSTVSTETSEKYPISFKSMNIKDLESLDTPLDVGKLAEPSKNPPGTCSAVDMGKIEINNVKNVVMTQFTTTAITGDNKYTGLILEDIKEEAAGLAAALAALPLGCHADGKTLTLSLDNIEKSDVTATGLTSPIKLDVTSCDKVALKITGVKDNGATPAEIKLADSGKSLLTLDGTVGDNLVIDIKGLAENMRAKALFDSDVTGTVNVNLPTEAGGLYSGIFGASTSSILAKIGKVTVGEKSFTLTGGACPTNKDEGCELCKTTTGLSGTVCAAVATVKPSSAPTPAPTRAPTPAPTPAAPAVTTTTTETTTVKTTTVGTTTTAKPKKTTTQKKKGKGGKKNKGKGGKKGKGNKAPVTDPTTVATTAGAAGLALNMAAFLIPGFICAY